MSLEPEEIDRLQDGSWTDLETLRQVPDLVELLHPRLKDNGEPRHTAWWITSGDGDASGPTLTVGIRGDVGFLHWYDDPDVNQVPAGTEYLDAPEQDYFTGGHHGAVIGPGEEISSALVYEAAAQFVATGQRPTCIDWMNEADVPDHRPPPPPPEEDPVYQALTAALEDGEAQS